MPEKEVEEVEEVKKREEEGAEEVKIHVKFVMSKEKTKVLFAEAGSDFTDALLSFLLLPLGTIVRVLKKRHGEKAPVIGSLSTLYNGVADLDSIHFLTKDAKSLLLNPTSLDEDEWPVFDGDFTETTASFVISDDLRVMLSVEGSVMSTLSNLGIVLTDMDGAESWGLDFGYNEILYLLRLMFISSNPLTALFRGSRISRAAGQGNAVNQLDKKAHLINSKKMILKAMMQKSTNKLLFAQADNDFVSFLFGLLNIPLGRVEWYLHSNTGVRATDNLHRSIQDCLYNNNLITPQEKDLLFNGSSCREMDTGYNEYIPLNFDRDVSKCYVRRSRMYMVSDNLTVAPLSITSSVSVIKEMKIPLSDVEEVEVEVGLEEGLSILKAALTSTTALTDGLIKPILMKKQPLQEH